MGLYSGGDYEPLNVEAMDVTFTRSGGDLRRTWGRSAWMIVVIGSEWEVPPRSSALRGNVTMSVRFGVECIGRHVLMHVCCPLKVGDLGEGDNDG